MIYGHINPLSGRLGNGCLSVNRFPSINDTKAESKGGESTTIGACHVAHSSM
jgi:hypothetical protein